MAFPGGLNRTGTHPTVFERSQGVSLRSEKWTFNVNSKLDLNSFYLALCEFWLSGQTSRSQASASLVQIARQGQPALEMLRRCLPLLEREVRQLSAPGSVAEARALTQLYLEIKRLTQGHSYVKVQVSLPKRGRFRKSTKGPLREIGAPTSFDRRHVLADFFFKSDIIPTILNQLASGDEQAEYLREVGCDPALFCGNIQVAARKWQLNIFNHLDNLHMGPGHANRVLGARGVVLDLAPWQNDLLTVLRRDLADILGTYRRLNPAIAHDIEQQVIHALRQARLG